MSNQDNDIRILTFRVGLGFLMPDRLNSGQVFSLSQFGDAAHIEEGWHPIGHQLTPLPSDELLITFLLERDSTAAVPS